MRRGANGEGACACPSCVCSLQPEPRRHTLPSFPHAGQKVLSVSDRYDPSLIAGHVRLPIDEDLFSLLQGTRLAGFHLEVSLLLFAGENGDRASGQRPPDLLAFDDDLVVTSDGTGEEGDRYDAAAKHTPTSLQVVRQAWDAFGNLC